MSRGRNLEREQYWRGVMERQLASGVSIAEFCRQESISPPSFYQWRKRLRSRDSEASQQSAAPKFQQLTLPGAAKAALELSIGDWTIAVSPGVDLETLSNVVRVMEEPRC